MTQVPEEIEKKLVPRLKYLGYLLLAFSLIALGYHIFAEPEEELLLTEEELLSELTDPPLINMMLVAGAFSAVGATCITIAWRKNAANIDR